jgi:trigger factor
VIASKNIERLANSSVKLSITVPSAEAKKEYDAMLREYSKSVRIDGFRAGHVPAPVLERKFGDSLRLDAMGRVLEKAVEEALKDADPKEQPLAYSTPSLDGDPDFAVDKDFSFAVKYDVFPSIEVGDWKGIDVEKPTVEISPEDEERELLDVRERNAIVIERDASAAAEASRSTTMAFRSLTSWSSLSSSALPISTEGLSTSMPFQSPTSIEGKTSYLTAKLKSLSRAKSGSPSRLGVE